MQEWYQVPGYEGLYEITRNGLVRSLDRRVRGKLGSTIFKRGIIITINPNSSGYFTTGFSKYGVSKLIMIHRIIAVLFVFNPDKKPCVNHINGIKTDNRIENLEWCTHGENSRHARALGLFKDMKGVPNFKNRRPNPSRNKRVIQFDVNWNKIKEFACSLDACKEVGSSIDPIRFAARKGTLTEKGFRYKYV